MHPSWYVSLPEGMCVEASGEGELTLQSPVIRLVLRRLSPATQQAIWRLLHPGDTVRRLLASLEESGVPDAMARFFYYLQYLAARQSLCISAAADGRRLATLMPTAPSFVLPPPGLADQACVVSRFAYLRREDGEMVWESPLSPARVVVHSYGAAQLPCALAQPATAAELSQRLPGLSEDGCAQLFGLFLAARMLTAVDARGSAEEDENPSLLSWEFHDLVFHARSRPGRHNAPIGNTYRFVGRLPPPPALKPVTSSETFQLDRPDIGEMADRDPPLGQVMEQRRSIRQYAADPITARQLGEFLYRSARVKARWEEDLYTFHGPVRMELTSRPYPTGGSLFALEIYPVIQRCSGMPSGLYRYDPAGHCLERLAGLTADATLLLANAGAAAMIPAEAVQILLIYSARFQRVAWKYASLAYALILKDVGALMQTMYLAAAAMELAPCAVGAGDSDLFARAIGSEYYDETSVGEFLLGSKE